MNDASVFDCGGVGKVSTSSVMGTSLPERRRHRSWPEALKREIVAASLVPGSSVSVVARHYDVNANQVFAWAAAISRRVSGTDCASTDAGNGDVGSAD